MTLPDYVADETPVQKAINDGHHWISMAKYESSPWTAGRASAVIQALIDVATQLYVEDNSAELARKDEIIAELKRGLAEKGNR